MKRQMRNADQKLEVPCYTNSEQSAVVAPERNAIKGGCMLGLSKPRSAIASLQHGLIPCMFQLSFICLSLFKTFAIANKL